MIVVIADDLTGAAELAGVGWRYGLRCEVRRVLALDSGADLIAVDADTRLLPVGAAARRVAALACACTARGIDRVFKKVDSVLRGHVVAEMTALMEGLGRTRGLLVPANPRLGRTITGGRYFVNGLRLDETEFAQDPAYPVRSADVLDLLGPSSVFPVRTGGCREVLPERGIVVGDAATRGDVDTWAASLDASVVPAGAAEFFAAYLATCGHRAGVGADAGFVPTSVGSSLFISGSLSSASHEFCTACDLRAVPVVRMPVRLFDELKQTQPLVAEWSERVLRAFDISRVVVLAIDRPLSAGPDAANRLSGHLTEAAEHVLTAHSVEQVFVEGGATAAALVRRLGWPRLAVVAELAPGTISLRLADGREPVLTMKPGSYQWPAAVLALVSGVG